MKILHVLNELRPSGAEIMLKNAGTFWHELGVECEVLSTGASIGPYADALKAAGYRVHHLPSKRRPDYFLDFYRFVRNGSYDIVHQHAEGMSYWFGLASLIAGARLVRTVHSNFQFEGNLRWRRTIQRRHLQSLGARFITIASGVKDNEYKRFGIKSNLIWNWIDTTHFSPIKAEERAAARQHWNISDDEIVIISVGNCATSKNHEELIKAIAKIPKSARIRYIHAGIEDVNSQERSLTKKLGISDQVIFTGWIKNTRDALSAADLFVMPSLYEGFSIAALEALSVGLPALLSKVAGLRDLEPLIPHLCYCQPTSESIAKELNNYISTTRSECKHHAKSYPEIIRNNFSIENGVQKYHEVYKSFFKNHNNTE